MGKQSLATVFTSLVSIMSDLRPQSPHRLKALLNRLCHHWWNSWQPREDPERFWRSWTLTQASFLPQTLKLKLRVGQFLWPLMNWSRTGCALDKAFTTLLREGQLPDGDLSSTGAGHWHIPPIQELQFQRTHQCYAKPSQVLDAETVGPVSNSWCSATVQEASAFLLHSQLASAFGKVQSSSSKDAIHQFSSIQA